MCCVQYRNSLQTFRSSVLYYRNMETLQNVCKRFDRNELKMYVPLCPLCEIKKLVLK